MTGGEMVPAAKAAGKAIEAARDAVSDPSSVKDRLAEMAKDDPALKRASSNYARTLELKSAIVLKIFAKVAGWAGISREYFESDFAVDMAVKTAGVPEDDLVSPTPQVAVPALQGLGISLDEAELKEMYLNLLATAADGRRSNQAHPAFADVIRQLTGEEAACLRTYLQWGDTEIVELRLRVQDMPGSYNTLHRHLVPYPPDEDPGLLSMWIDNWVRLGLVSVSYSISVTGVGAYDWVERHATYRRYREQWPDAVLHFQRGVIEATDFGRRFALAVVSEDEASEVAPSEGAAPDGAAEQPLT